jgi:hypothetical protein
MLIFKRAGDWENISALSHIGSDTYFIPIKDEPMLRNSLRVEIKSTYLEHFSPLALETNNFTVGTCFLELLLGETRESPSPHTNKTPTK